jgi:hypothetical protein
MRPRSVPLEDPSSIRIEPEYLRIVRRAEPSTFVVLLACAVAPLPCADALLSCASPRWGASFDACEGLAERNPNAAQHNMTLVNLAVTVTQR